MAVEILMPKLGLTMKTGTVLKWLKEEGDPVAEKEALLEIETEKLSHQIESPVDGVLLKKRAVPGEKYPVAFVVGYVGRAGEELPAEASSPASQPASAAVASPNTGPAPPVLTAGERVLISPVARKLAAQLGIDFTRIRGTGPNGRIVKADVQRYADEKPAEASGAAAEADTVIPYSGMRRAIGENMLHSWRTIPMVTHQVSVCVSALTQLRALLNEGVADKNERVSVNDLLLKLTAAALEKTPMVNASFTEEGIVLHKRVHLGMATALDNGLVVPVIRDANHKSLLALSQEARDLAARARSGGLTPDELQGATFTVSNLGGYGSVDHFTPIVNPPQAAILGVGRTVDTPAVTDGGIGILPMMGLSFTYDHRIVDGATAAGFIKTLMQLLEHPARAVI